MNNQILSLVERLLGRGHFSGQENMSVKCPFHKGGEETRPSFSVNVTNGVWQCFTCKASGSLPKLLKMLGLPRHVIDDELKGLRHELEYNKKQLLWRKEAKWVHRDPFLAPLILPEALLRPYEFCPTKLTDAGFRPEWLQWMDVGYDRNRNRIVYPVRDLYGNLAGIVGGASIAGQSPKYLAYQGKHKDPITGRAVSSHYGSWFDDEYPNYDFEKSNYLWNFDNVYPRLFFGTDIQTLIIVEGFKACLWLLQNGWENTVALMGSSMSEQQCSLLHRLRINIVLFLDDDEAGREGTRKIAKRLLQFEPGVSVARYPHAEDEELQPDNLEPAELTASITGSVSYPSWRRRQMS